MAGSVISNRAPSCISAAADSFPPCCSIIVLQIARPNPVPFAFVVTNGSKMRVSLSGSIPGPVISLTGGGSKVSVHALGEPPEELLLPTAKLMAHVGNEKNYGRRKQTRKLGRPTILPNRALTGAERVARWRARHERHIAKKTPYVATAWTINEWAANLVPRPDEFAFWIDDK